MSVLQAASLVASQVPYGTSSAQALSLVASPPAGKAGYGEGESVDSFASRVEQPQVSSGFLCGIPLMIGAVGAVMAFSTALCLKACACCCIGVGALGGGAFALNHLLKR